MSGIQEILLLGVIVVALIYLPRLRAKRPPQVVVRSRSGVPGWLRVAVVISLLWLLGATVWWRPWQGTMERFLLMGVAPLMAAWGVIWVLAGYRKRK